MIDIILCVVISYFVHSKVKNGKLYLATFAAILGPLSFGFVLGYSSPAIPDLCRIPDPRMRLNPEEASWFGVREAIQLLQCGLVCC